MDFNFLFTFFSILAETLPFFEGELQLSQRVEKEKISVLIIGAGAAGLKAGEDLVKAGYNVTLLEAMDRVGGRMHTVQIGNGNYMELGAEWFHGEKGNSVFELVEPLGLTNSNKEEEGEETLNLVPSEFGFQNGEILNSSISDKLWDIADKIWFDREDWAKAIKGRNDTNMGQVAELILETYNEKYKLHDNSTFLQAALDWAHRAMCAEDGCGTNWYDISKCDIGDQYIPMEGNFAGTWKPPYSYNSLIQLILTGNVTAEGKYEIPSWIRLNEEVTSIKYSETYGVVKVVTSKGEELFPDHVIYTGSLGVLKAKHSTIFHPNLSERKRLAIETLGFGSVTKIAYEFQSKWWPENYESFYFLWNDYTDNDTSLQYWRSDITRSELLSEVKGHPLWVRGVLCFFTVPSGSAPKIMRVWASGAVSKLMDDLDPAYIDEKVMALLRQFKGTGNGTGSLNISDPVRRWQTKWASNPFTRGTYSYRTVESQLKDVWARDLAEPVKERGSGKPLILFAGEATNPTQYATVNGAYDTGVREFQRIEDFYK